ncbi:FtsK/SpoIIIE domain-containing protein [Paractinoplanes hotanensis]|uniref:FtsK/SpoIIIE domain-containing protein n=1 Tax=Paractinoplanes hotanensis TaxID=2906497 RepID=A0ABT0Y4Z6_9ACTN|nr:FtsK/SpoIIIE domain-containing protein [Actinoplanes hotanensis]MCM4081101.1 FtsK/SpoIIIE domain-containing protein [Actinoplanes hotanensis]
MRISVREQWSKSSVDVVIGAAAPEATVAELLDAIAGRAVGAVVVDVDGVAVPGDTLIADLPARCGSVVRLGGRAQAPQRPAPGAMELRRIAGPDAGHAVTLPPGEFLIGRGGEGGLRLGRVREPVLRLEVEPGTAGRVSSVNEPVRLDGTESDSGAATVVVAGDTVFRLAPAEPQPPVLLSAPVDQAGRVPLVRTPRVAVPPPTTVVAVPPPPAAASPPAPMSWLLMLAPLPIGIVMALVFSPFFLLMTAMTPLMGLARWVESKYQARKDKKRLAAASAAAVEQFTTDLDARREQLAAAARREYADLAVLLRRAETGRGLWEVRPGDEDEMRAVVGFGSRVWQPELGRRGADALSALPVLADVLDERTRLADVPVHLNLRDRTGFGAIGQAEARRVVSAVVLDLVTRHGPADLELVLLAEPDRLGAWDWAKWLPHLAADSGLPRVAADPVAAVELLGSLDAGTTRTSRGLMAASPSPERPACLMVVIDGARLLTGRVAALLGRLAGGRGRVLVVAERVEQLPSVCQQLLETTSRVLTDAVTGELQEDVLAVQAGPVICARTARALARWTDPEQAAAAAVLPDRARLMDLLLAAASGPDGLARPITRLDAGTVGAWWRRGSAGLQATIGVTEEGPLSLDLLADGPHGLVVGTTGAGKSELLRTVVAALACAYPPDVLTFMLVDFKGGGAFDACAALPHTVGLVTDLDEHLAARALRCLRAELRHRELRLRAAGVSDLRDYLDPNPVLPRLVIVIDEFATLAVELPGFLSALIDVAQRGRSLGIHLLLATQRPQGVVDGKIRANTNLRVALRVQDDADSRDVLGSRQAADIDRRRPGRAYVRLGAGEVVAVQTALVSAAGPGGTGERISVTPFTLINEATPSSPAAVAEGLPTDLEQLVAITTAAADAGGYEPPRVPWPAPLPSEVDGWELPGSYAAPDMPSPVSSTGVSPAPVPSDPVPLGLVDLPDEQRSDVWWWRPEDGGTVVLGADSAATGAVLAAACVGLARCRPPDRQRIFVLDGQGGRFAPLTGLPHVGAVVGAHDGERLRRVLDHLDAEVARRRSEATGGPDLLLVVAGWAALVEAADRAGLADAEQRLERLLRDGAPTGLRLLVSAPHDRGLPGRVMAQMPVKLCLRLADASSYTGLGLRARDVPELRGLRAIEIEGRLEIQIGRYDVTTAVERVAAAYPDAVPAPSVGVLPALVAAADVLDISGRAGTTWRLGVGRYYQDLSVASLSLAPGMHVIVAGPPGSGRTTALRMLAAAALAGDPDATVCVVAADPAAWADAPVDEVAAGFDGLTAWPGDTGRGLLLVDGIESLGPGAGTALDRLIPAVPAGGHVIVSGRPEAFRGMQPWQRAVTMSRTGLLLRPTPDDGDILRIRLPREAPPRPVPGRGYLVEAGGTAQIQTACPEPPAPAGNTVGARLSESLLRVVPR